MARVKIERKTDWLLRIANPDDKEKITSFYKENIWKNKDVQALYKWKYEGNPFGQTIMWVGINGSQQVISNCVFMPWKFRLNGKTIGATQSVDGVTQLEYRGQGITFKQLNSGMEEAGKTGAQLCFAFPNENGAAVHRKNNGHYLGYILRFTKPLRSEYLINRFIKTEILLKAFSFIGDIILRLCSKETYSFNLNGYIIKKEESCGNDIDNFWNKFKNKFDYKITTDKNSSYLDWKYLNSPNKNRQLFTVRKNSTVCGFVVLESTPQIGYIIDLLAYDKNALNFLIAYAIKYFRKICKDSVVFIALENNIYLKNFEKFGFVKRPEEKHFYIYLDENMENKEFFMDSKNWFITIGDCDIEKL